VEIGDAVSAAGGHGGTIMRCWHYKLGVFPIIFRPWSDVRMTDHKALRPTRKMDSVTVCLGNSPSLFRSQLLWDGEGLNACAPEDEILYLLLFLSFAMIKLWCPASVNSVVTTTS
jgi:hypothetical protein